MRRSEKAWLATGIFIGVVVAGGVYRYFETAGTVYDRPGRSAPPLQESETSADRSLAIDQSVFVELTSDEQNAVGIETVEVQRRAIRKEITAPGKVAEPETGIAAISARIGGRIDRLFIKVTGETVGRGQPVAVIYSPEVFTAGEEYRLALESRQRLAASTQQQAIADADALVQASRRRLDLWGLTTQQIDEIASAPERPTQITIYAGISGIITKRNVSEGQYVRSICQGR
jgi:membrane fusion protein, copper/silver efflux system